MGTAAIALWFHMCLLSCGPGFKSQAQHLRVFTTGMRIGQKEAGIVNIDECYNNLYN